MSIKSLAKSITVSIPALALIAGVLFSGFMLFQTVNLKPQVEPNFFFADDDPQYQTDLKIKEIFPEPEQLILAVKGPIHSKRYQEKIKKLSLDILGLPPIYSVQSIMMGPADIEAAFNGELWKRVLLSHDQKATLLIGFTNRIPDEALFEEIETIASHYEDMQFEVLISGSPYVVDLIRRYLWGDLKTFTVAALIMFTIMMLVIFRSLRILMGIVTTCCSASIATLFATFYLKIPMGPLTANISTIVFVLTLSHIAYMTFNWKHIMEHESLEKTPIRKAIQITLQPSFWSMLTTFLGFTTLIFVQAAPLNRLGYSGAVGTLIAFVCAYLIYPWFLLWKKDTHHTIPAARPQQTFLTGFLKRKHPMITLTIFASVFVAAIGLWKINHDPHLLSYFKPGTELRDGLDYIDRNWGSSVLKLVIADRENRKLTSDGPYDDQMALLKSLEEHPAVGNAISLPLILKEAEDQTRFSFLVSRERFLKELSKPQYGELTQQFVTSDRKKALIFLRMQSLYRDIPRKQTIEEIKTTVKARGFVLEMVGGLYLLQGELGELVITSLFKGLGMLMILFFLMGLFLSRSVFVTGAMLTALATIPVWLLGIIGHFKIPLDMISAPATNLAIAMGVDAMIHLIMMVKRLHRDEMMTWDAWVEARMRLWKPILSSITILCAGFSIFTLSYFPPTQRFGTAILAGSAMAAVATLLILPTLAGPTGDGRKPKKIRTRIEDFDISTQN